MTEKITLDFGDDLDDEEEVQSYDYAEQGEEENQEMEDPGFIQIPNDTEMVVDEQNERQDFFGVAGGDGQESYCSHTSEPLLKSQKSAEKQSEMIQIDFNDNGDDNDDDNDVPEESKQSDSIKLDNLSSEQNIQSIVESGIKINLNDEQNNEEAEEEQVIDDENIQEESYDNKIKFDLNADLEESNKDKIQFNFNEDDDLPEDEDEDQPASLLESDFIEKGIENEAANSNVIEFDINNNEEEINTITIPFDQNVQNEIPVNLFDPINQFPTETEPVKTKAHFHITDFYSLNKVKYTLDFGQNLEDKQLIRSQFIYTLQRKSEEQINDILMKCKENGHKRVYIDIGIHIKQMKVNEMWLLHKPEGSTRWQKKSQIQIPGESQVYGNMPSISNSKKAFQNMPHISQEYIEQSKSKSWYLPPISQAKLFSDCMGTSERPFVSQDLNTVDYVHKDICNYQTEDGETISQKPELHISKFITVKLKKDDYLNQLDEQIKLLITIGKPMNSESCSTEPITDFGIRAIDFKNQSQISKSTKTSTYFVTSDSVDAHQLWMPSIYNTTETPFYWSMNYIIPKNAQVVSSGQFRKEQALSDTQSMFVFKCKDSKMITSNIGFVIANFGYVSVIQSDQDQNMGHAQFITNNAHTLFEENHFYATQVQQMIAYQEKMLKIEHPCNVKIKNSTQHKLKLIFLPNFKNKNCYRQSSDFGNCLHIFDNDILLPRNIIEKRPDIYKILSTSLSTAYFGNQVWVQNQEDRWLITAIQERMGDHYMRIKCGQSYYRYCIAKRMNKYYKLTKQNSERFSLNSKYIPHFSELHYSGPIYYLKCGLIMHTIEMVLGEITFLYNILRELYRKSKPTFSLAQFKKQLKDIGVKRFDTQQNWIESTSCPKMNCEFTYNRKNNSVDITLTQHSNVKRHCLWEQYIQENKDQVLQMCTNGNLINQSLLEQQYNQQIDKNNKFEVDVQRQARRWFSGEIKVAIYQTDGADITVQTQKIKIGAPKSVVNCNISLQMKVRKAIHNKKKDNLMMIDTKDDDKDDKEVQRATKEEQLHQLMDDSQWRFGLNQVELDDYPERGTKSLFEVKNIDCPILWIRVDPEIEFFRKIKVVQSKENWLFQLLQEKDHLAKIEACKALSNYNEEFIYEILKSVAKNPQQFFKVRKQALKSLQKINVREFSQYQSHEKSFLVWYYNQRNLDEKIGFYKQNDFSNLTEYYMNTYLLDSLANCKEHKLAVQENLINLESTQIINQLQLTGLQIRSNQITSYSRQLDDDTKVENEQQIKKTAPINEIESNNYRTTTAKICQLMLKLLQENDNSINAFDDCHWLSKVIRNLGKLDNWQYMPSIAQEIIRHFNLDHIGKFSCGYSVSKGAISAYYSILESIFKFTNVQHPYLDLSKCGEEERMIEQSIKQTKQIIDPLGQSLQQIMLDVQWPLELRSFIYQKQIMNSFLFEGTLTDGIPTTFLNPLFHTLQGIRDSFAKLDFQFGAIQLQILAEFVEQNLKKRLNFRECLIPNHQKTKIIAKQIWYIMASQPATILDRQISHWGKRLYLAVFQGNNLPLCLEFEQKENGIVPPFILNIDQDWNDTEIQQQLNSDQQEVQRQLNKQDIDMGQNDIQDTLPVGTLDTNFLFGLPGHNDLLLSQNNPANQFQFNQDFLGNQQTVEQLLQQRGVHGRSNDMPNFDINQDANSNVIKLDLLNTQNNDAIMEFGNYIDNNDDTKNLDESNDRSASYKPINYDEWPDQEHQIESGDEDVIVQEELDDFPDYNFSVIWQQKCWDILYRLYYDVESGAFLLPITPESMGKDGYEDYCSIIANPINFLDIKEKMIKNYYPHSLDFIDDMTLVFSNCVSYNSRTSSIYKSAMLMKRKFQKMIKEQGIK